MAIVRGAAKDNYKFSSLVLGIANSDAFRKQGLAVVPKQTEVKTVAANRKRAVLVHREVTN